MGRYRRCIILLADGARADVMEQMLADGELPNMQRYLVEKGSYRRAITAFPSTTGPAYLPFLTGCYPGRCNIPGIRWFDREKFHEKTPGVKWCRSYIILGNLQYNSDLSKQVKTLFEIFEKSVSISNSISRGANLMCNRNEVTRTLYSLFSYVTRHWSLADRATARDVLSALKEKPNFIYAVFPAIDKLSHFTHPFSKEVLEAYRQIDSDLGKIVTELKRVNQLEDTLLVLTSDHGLTATHTHFDSEQFLERRGMKVLRHPKILRKHFSAVVMVSGNAMAHLYVKNLHGWGKRTPYQELRQGNCDLIYELIQEDAIDFVASKDDDDQIHVTYKNGEAIIKEEDGVIYYTRNGDDPFGYNKIPNVLTYKTSLEMSFDSEFPDALVQLIQIFKSKRSGDIILNMKNGFDLRVKFDVLVHRSSHGSLHREHMQVPLLINHEIKRKYIRTVDVFPSILELTGKKHEGKIGGKSFI